MTTPKAKFAGLALIPALCAGFTLGLTAPAWADLDEAETIEASQGLPVVPTLEHVLGIPAQYLAAGYLAVDATVSMAEIALRLGITVNVALDGKKETITQVNAESYLKAYRKRLEIYRQAIEQRGFAEIAGRYALNANASCQGQKIGMSGWFAIGERDGKPVIADELVVRQTGFKADIIQSETNQCGQPEEVIFPGLVVEDAVIFSAPSNLGFNFWGVVEERAVKLRVDVKEYQNAIGAHTASESDWQTLAKCVFTLTPLLYSKGEAVPQDYERARTGAETPPAEGDFDAGDAEYFQGDYATAVREWRPLAEQGHAKAQFYLGVMYGFGQCVPRDYVQAHMWFNVAASRHPPGRDRDLAVRNRDIYAKLMTPAQISEAQKLAREWKPKK